uniref:UBC core domain-containing protein n=1 Tax=Tetradesmus obliquus TaxID=3088 RepID=A0A383WGQ0_TETOB|eukprot:jgi/Sobl393_1/1097/SZX72051.1
MKQLTVMTIEGQKSLINVDDDTTNRSLLQTVAHAINSPADALRIAYAGREIDCSNNSAFRPNDAVNVLHVVKRMQGGSPAAELARQMRRQMSHPIPGISVGPSEDDVLTWYVKLSGPAGTPYSGGWFDVELKFPSDFPRSMPTGRFLTPIWHPNVGSEGSICIGQERDDGGACAVECVLAALLMLLATPNASSALNKGCAKQYEYERDAYREKAAAMTRQHAMG